MPSHPIAEENSAADDERLHVVEVKVEIHSAVSSACSDFFG